MVAVVFEVALSGAGPRDMPQQDRQRGCGHREAHRRYASGPVVPLPNLAAPPTRSTQASPRSTHHLHAPPTRIANHTLPMLQHAPEPPACALHPPRTAQRPHASRSSQPATPSTASGRSTLLSSLARALPVAPSPCPTPQPVVPTTPASASAANARTTRPARHTHDAQHAARSIPKHAAASEAAACTACTAHLPCNYPILPIHANRDHGPATDCLAQTLPHAHMTRPDCTLCDHVTYMT